VDLREGSASKRQRSRTALDGKTETTNRRDDNDIPGRDPTGPLAPLGGPNPLLQQLYFLLPQDTSDLEHEMPLNG